MPISVKRFLMLKKFTIEELESISEKVKYFKCISKNLANLSGGELRVLLAKAYWVILSYSS